MVLRYNWRLVHSAWRRSERFAQGIKTGPVYPQSKLLGCALSKFRVNSVVVEFHNHSFTDGRSAAFAGINSLMMASLQDQSGVMRPHEGFKLIDSKHATAKWPRHSVLRLRKN